jgi:hypothetical protein
VPLGASRRPNQERHAGQHVLQPARPLLHEPYKARFDGIAHGRLCNRTRTIKPATDNVRCALRWIACMRCTGWAERLQRKVIERYRYLTIRSHKWVLSLVITRTQASQRWLNIQSGQPPITIAGVLFPCVCVPAMAASRCTMIPSPSGRRDRTPCAIHHTT